MLDPADHGRYWSWGTNSLLNKFISVSYSDNGIYPRFSKVKKYEDQDLYDPCTRIIKY